MGAKSSRQYTYQQYYEAMKKSGQAANIDLKNINMDTIDPYEVFNISKALDDLSQTSVTSFNFDKERSELISTVDIGYPQQIKYACSVWQKKPWWKIL